MESYRNGDYNGLYTYSRYIYIYMYSIEEFMIIDGCVQKWWDAH